MQNYGRPAYPYPQQMSPQQAQQMASVGGCGDLGSAMGRYDPVRAAALACLPNANGMAPAGCSPNDIAASQAYAMQNPGAPQSPWCPPVNAAAMACGPKTIQGIPRTVIPPAVLGVNGTAQVTITPLVPSVITSLEFPSDIVATLAIESATLNGQIILTGPIPLRMLSEVSEACCKCCLIGQVLYPWAGPGALILTISNSLAAPVGLLGVFCLQALCC